MSVKSKGMNDLYNIPGAYLYVSRLEVAINNKAKSKSENVYCGGNWSSKLIEINAEEKTSFWFWNLEVKDQDKKFPFPNYNKQIDEQVSPICFSILCTFFAIGDFLAFHHENEKLEELLEELHNLYYTIKSNVDKVLSKEETKIFWSIID